MAGLPPPKVKVAAVGEAQEAAGLELRARQEAEARADVLEAKLALAEQQLRVAEMAISGVWSGLKGGTKLRLTSEWVQRGVGLARSSNSAPAMRK